MNQGIMGRAGGVLVIVAALLLPSGVFAAGEVGIVLFATGGVTATGADGVSRELTRRSPVFAGDLLRSAPGARAQVKFTDHSIVALKPASTLRIDAYTFQADGSGAQTSVMSLIKGGLRTVTGVIGKTNQNDYRLNTPVATIGVRGTLYEVWFEENKGLDVGVWDGAIAACSSSGECLDLGMGADHRFGFVPVDGGAPKGQQDAPDSMGDDAAPVDIDVSVDGEAVAVADSPLNTLESDLLDEDILPPVDLSAVSAVSTVVSRDTFPKFGFVSRPGSPLVVAGFARADVQASGVVDWSLVNQASGEVFSSGTSSCLDISCTSWIAYLGRIFSGTDVNGVDTFSEVIWGRWSRVAVGSSVDDPAPGVVVGNGYFVMADYVAPEVVAAMTGTMSVNYTNGMFDLSGVPFTQASGGLNVDFSTGSVGGSLQVADFNGQGIGNEWQLSLTGNVTAGVLALNIVTDVLTPTNGSYFMPANGAAGSQVAATGTIDASFFGNGSVDGVIGAVNVETVVPVLVGSIAGVQTLDGVFVLTPGLLTDAPQ